MSAITIIITDAGRAAIVNAQNTGTAPVTIAQCGVSPTAFAASKTTTVLPDEFKRIAALSGDVVDDDTIHLIVRDESNQTYAVRSFALYLADGTLFGVYSQAAPIIEKSAQSMLLLAIDIRFEDIDADLITFGDANFLLPPATTEIMGVVELATDDEADTGTDDRRVVTAKALRYAVTRWLDDRLGAGAPSAFMKTLLTAASAIALRAAIGIKSAALKDEGAGNGLDADLLDGQQGAYYTNIPARLGYVPWGPSNDGSGSGMDADTVDGRHASEFALLTGAIFTGALRATRFTATTDDGLRLLGAGPYISFYNAAESTRFGFIQHNATNIIIANEVGGGAVQVNNNFGIGAAPTTHFEVSNAAWPIARLRKAGVGFWDMSAGIGGAGGNSWCLSVNGGASLFEVNTNGDTKFAGNLGIGVTPSHRLHVKGGNAAFIPFSTPTGVGDAQQIMIGEASDNGLYRMRLGYYNQGTYKGSIDVIAGGVAADLVLQGSGGNVGIGIGPSYKLDVNGILNAGGFFVGGAALAGGTPAEKVLYAGTSFLHILKHDGSTAFVTLNNTTGGVSFTGSLTAGGSLVWTAGNDGAGSGMDADMLDGLHASQFWRPDNDGPGSGMDADMLDGLHASAFVLASQYASRSLAQNGYQVLPSGLIIQWGRFTALANTSTSVTFPIQFPNGAFAATVSGVSSGGVDQQDNTADVTSIAPAAMTVWSADNTHNTTHYIAIGY
ncbi:gp53-like domain-containing protein [Sphingomonas cavernae]|uniref:Putative tail fiber protein gp53-like C-terminal domain-containing protein n=1 Tax=Sphingomonas cavernae TaxID=2320861 RepID=A0A418WP20_9SPHN|nr:hypothetical protein [Sphingomonas cavernae]RJF92986.1 hypothetical protein D3876_00950 [Sphingomonas cavernae]